MASLKKVSISPSTNKVISLAEILGHFDEIKRATKLPSGVHESDSHHSFSLAITAYSVAKQSCPELDAEKVIIYALVHDLLELVSGDESTLHYDAADHAAKKAREAAAVPLLQKRLKDFPEILEALGAYEQLDQPESAFVYVLDKACTTWTHHFDCGRNLKDLGIKSRDDIDDWYKRLLAKIESNLVAQPPKIAFVILEESFARMRQECL
jgi:5'-deoxynucleotidase YfbR-like HD superfamily hydrolase